MSETKRSPRVPHELCKVLTIQRLVTTGLLDEEPCTSHRVVEIIDPLAPIGGELTPVRALKSFGGAVISFDGVHVQAFSRPLGSGRRWWHMECPRCKGRCRNLYLPPPALRGEWACRKCNRIRFPSQTRALRRAERAPDAEKLDVLVDGLELDRYALAVRLESRRRASGKGRLELAREIDDHRRTQELFGEIRNERGLIR